MREAMDRLGLTAGQVAYRMGVSSAAVRGWTSGRRGLDPDGLLRFARIVEYPLEYFLDPEYGQPASPSDFALVQELKKLTEQVQKLVEKVGSQPGYWIKTDEQAIGYLRDAHGLGPEAVAAIHRIIGKAAT